jgi:hypothetical protein
MMPGKHVRGDAVSRGRIARCDISAEAFVAGTPQLEIPPSEQFLACMKCTRKAAGFVPNHRLGEMYAAKKLCSWVQKLLPVVCRIGYGRY